MIRLCAVFILFCSLTACECCPETAAGLDHHGACGCSCL